MLKTYLGELDDPKYISIPDIYFNNTYQDSWMETEFSKDLIKDVDKSDIISPNCVISPFLGSIPVTRISGGTKTVLLLKYDTDHIFNLSSCGDNCAKWILKVGKEQDVQAILGHIMHWGEEPFEIMILNNGKIVHNMREFVNTYLEVMV